MNYHFLIDEKFIPDFIKDADKSKTQNEYIFLFKSPGKFIKSEKGIFAPHQSKILKDVIKNINPTDKVFIHWFHSEINLILDEIPKEVKVYLMFWGGDFLNLPSDCGYNNPFIKLFLEPKSFNYHKIESKKLRFLILFNMKSVFKSFLFLPYNIFKYFTFFKSNLNAYMEERKKFLNRIEGVCHWNSLDVSILEGIYKLNLKHIPFSYSVGTDNIFPLYSIKKHREDTIKIMLGNSDTITNNHLDAFEILRPYKDQKILIYCPLNYNNDSYTTTIIKKGKEIFGIKFIPMTDYIDRDNYYNFLSEIDICIMFHIRSQGAGNIITLLKKGIKVYLNDKSTIYNYFISIGLSIKPINLGIILSFNDFIRPLQEIEIQKNNEIIHYFFEDSNYRANNLINLLAN